LGDRIALPPQAGTSANTAAVTAANEGNELL
jgi:UDP-N-acetylmuramoyl-tripeptide--D-alanyl-D-alanine ligase